MLNIWYNIVNSINPEYMVFSYTRHLLRRFFMILQIAVLVCVSAVAIAFVIKEQYVVALILELIAFLGIFYSDILEEVIRQLLL